jgi:hypothetical protein
MSTLLSATTLLSKWEISDALKFKSISLFSTGCFYNNYSSCFHQIIHYIFVHASHEHTYRRDKHGGCGLLIFLVSCVLCAQCCQFLWIVHSWLSLWFSLTFVLYLVYPMLPVSLDCPFLIVPLVFSSNIGYTRYRTKVRENQRDNQEWTIQRNWQHWAHKIQDKG